MTNPMNDHGYRMPIPRFPTIHIQEEPEEDIPAPYAYTAIITPNHDREAIKAKFMQACNMKRWHHIHNAQVKVKAPK